MAVEHTRDSVDYIREALGKPIGMGSASFSSRGKTLLLLPDKTRNCGARNFLPTVLEHLNEQDISDEDITIMLANGSHVANSPDEIKKIVGDETLSRIRIVQHDSRADGELQHHGFTKLGTPVSLNNAISTCDQILIIGTAVHHYFAGFGGGPKMINPGCAGYETITRNHALTISLADQGMHPRCQPGVVEGNPVQEDIRDSFRFVDTPTWLLETVMDEHGHAVAAFWGELFQTHAHACARVDELYCTNITEKADLVIASCGGYPKDINMIQAHKTLCNAYRALEDGGILVLLAKCVQGLGSRTFMEWFEYRDMPSLLAALSESYKLNGTTALSMRQKCRDARVFLVSSLDERVVKELGMVPFQHVGQAFKAAQEILPPSFRCFVMPIGSLTLPVGGANVVCK